MKITINIDDKLTETQIHISSPALSAELEKMIAALRIYDQQMVVFKGEESVILEVAQIVYVESVDRKTFVYTRNNFYETKLRLYEMEEQLCQSGFLRTSKSCLVQLKQIRTLKTELNRKLRVTLENGEQLMVSRQYADELKRRLGVM
ncbi:MAG: LytTR family DNA-binding domain-containing protein [Oscillospiraceae bacterium]|jgi:DNA-binding LytR/AlgR family response regulator|nr:LytTR family DNA-binding domain-containing protein [Oscillospiraceae bacterium]